jgi:Zn-dependent protease with chaperone function
MAVSRKREYLADATGAQFSRNPEALARALEKIDAASTADEGDHARGGPYVHRGSWRAADQREARDPGRYLRLPSAIG